MKKKKLKAKNRLIQRQHDDLEEELYRLQKLIPDCESKLEFYPGKFVFGDFHILEELNWYILNLFPTKDQFKDGFPEELKNKEKFWKKQEYDLNK